MAEEKGKPGRPRVLVRRHKIELPEDVDLKELLMIHEAAQVGKGFLSTNAGAIIATFGVASALLAIPATRKIIIDFLAFWRDQITTTIKQAIVPGQIPTLEDIRKEIQDAIDKLFPPGEEPPEIQFGTPVGAIPFSGEQLELLRRLREEGEQDPL